jgi:hypothetical protein
MGVWEADIQMSSGAVMSGKMNPDPQPASSTLGKSCSAGRTSTERLRDERFLRAGNRAADCFYVNEQDIACSVLTRDAAVMAISIFENLVLGRVSEEGARPQRTSSPSSGF